MKPPWSPSIVVWPIAALLVASCASLPEAPGLAGKPIGEFFDDLKSELRDVHWRVRSVAGACGSTGPREVDLRNATISLDLQRVGEASIDGALRLVALPLAGGALTPYGSAGGARKFTQEIVLKLDVTGPDRVYDVADAPVASGSVARTLNAAIDGFVRSGTEAPCVRLTSLKLTFVVDVRREVGGGFKVVVPVADVGIDASRRDVNTLTISWDRIASNALR